MLAAPLRRSLPIAREISAVIHCIDLWTIASIITLCALCATAAVAAVAAAAAGLSELKAARSMIVGLPQTPLVPPALGHVSPDVDDLVDSLGSVASNNVILTQAEQTGRALFVCVCWAGGRARCVPGRNSRVPGTGARVLRGVPGKPKSGKSHFFRTQTTLKKNLKVGFPTRFPGNGKHWTCSRVRRDVRREARP